MVVGGSRLDLWKKEKKAMRHVAQNVASRDEERFVFHSSL